MLAELGILTKDISVLSQKYTGDITVLPDILQGSLATPREPNSRVYTRHASSR